MALKSCRVSLTRPNDNKKPQSEANWNQIKLLIVRMINCWNKKRNSMFPVPNIFKWLDPFLLMMKVKPCPVFPGGWKIDLWTLTWEAISAVYSQQHELPCLCHLYNWSCGQLGKLPRKIGVWPKQKSSLSLLNSTVTVSQCSPNHQSTARSE